MSIGRTWRTIRHLSAEQWLYRLICRGRRLQMRHTPRHSRRRIERHAAALPLPDISTDIAADIARVVLQLQTAVHGDSFAGTPQGRFELLNREYDFGSVSGIPWRGEFHEGNNPLRRMNLAYMGYVVPLLARGREEDLGTVADLVRSLEDGNPWSAPGVFRDVWNAYTASHRLLNLLSGLALYHQAGGPARQTEFDEIRRHARLCAAFVRANLERDLQFNHLMKNYVALSAYAALCPSVPARFRMLRDAVPGSIAQNILADGGHAERCPMYHVLSLLDVRIIAASRLYPDHWQPLLDDTAQRMETALRAMTLADGEISLMNDSWVGEAPRAERAADLSATGAVESVPLTGYLRLGGVGETAGDSVVFDVGLCGPHDNPGHAHADFLSVETTVTGLRFLVDTGVPTYTAGAARDASRSAAAHNGPRLVDDEPIEFWKSFRVGRRGRAGLLDVFFPELEGAICGAGWQSGYAHLGTDVRRLVALWPGAGLLVADLWRGQFDGAVSSYLVPGEWSAETNGAFAQNDVRVHISGLVGQIGEIVRGSHWYRFGVERHAHRFDVIARPGGSSARAALLFHWGGSAPVVSEPMLERIFERLAAADAGGPP